MTPQELATAAATLIERTPTADLVKNAVWNLSVMVDRGDGVEENVGWVDLVTGEVALLADHEECDGQPV